MLAYPATLQVTMGGEQKSFQDLQAAELYIDFMENTRGQPLSPNN